MVVPFWAPKVTYVMFYARVKNRVKPPKKSCESLANGFAFAAKHAKFHNFLKIVRKTTANAFAKGEKISFTKSRSQTPVRTLLQTETYCHFAKSRSEKKLRKDLQNLKTRKTFRKTICETFCER